MLTKKIESEMEVKLLLKEFKQLLEENNSFPKDELRDYYLINAKNLLKKHPELATQVIEEQTALQVVIKKIIKGGNHHIRLTHLNLLAWDLIEKSSKELLNFQDRDGNSVIHLASLEENFSVGILDLIKEHGGDFNLLNKKNELPLHMVAGSDSLDDVKFIHAYTDSKNINIQDINGNTPLIIAVKEKKINNVYFLLNNGADVFVKNNKNQTALQFLLSEQTEKIERKSPAFTINQELITMLSLFEEKQKAELQIKNLNKIHIIND